MDDLEATEFNGDAEHVIPDSPKHDGGSNDGSPMVSHTVSSMPCAVPAEELVVQSCDVEDGCPKLVSPTIIDKVRTKGVSVQVSVPSECEASKVVTPRRKRAGSCPPRAGRSLVSGSWSMEWLRDQVHGDASIVSSSRKKGKQVVLSKEGLPLYRVTVSTRKKVGGLLRHSVHSLKKVARLPSKDRSAMLHDLKRRVHKRHGKETQFFLDRCYKR